MTDMTALRAHHRGGPEVLTVEQAPVPVPAPGEVLVAVHAAAITFDELIWTETWMRDGADRTPTIPSHEVSGVVAATGTAADKEWATEFAIGDEVFGLIPFDRDGAAAEYVTVPAADLAARPSTVSHTESAALPLAGLTAWQALVEHAHVQAGESVLVLGGAGGVGALTVELACSLGAEVTTTVRSDAARDLVTKLGAVHVIDTRTIEFDGSEFDGAATSYDVAVDTVGGQTLERAFAVLRPGGRLVTLSGPPPEGMAEAYDVESTFFIVTPDRSQLARLAELVDAGRLHVAIAATFPLRDGRAAFESGRLSHRRPGKTVLIVRD
jgi:NADPH:quinone reductase-like Zn-dependent oxidoreductase